MHVAAVERKNCLQFNSIFFFSSASSQHAVSRHFTKSVQSKSYRFQVGCKVSLTGRNFQENQAQCEQSSAMTNWGFQKTGHSHKNNIEALIQENFLCENKTLKVVVAALVASSRRETQISR
ncbi:hypothetical protein ATANTOWER_017532 [Ataeniobius toweri]|uniref:Uncharacterized protein n=1 Tax=Ataeniobius toweri TaxID=208326 RepID=A0ABU7BZM6_9TELE|nr:hypothetical protein [Ataeniobius toweri]